MSKPHLAFRNFRPELIEATNALFDARVHTLTNDEGAIDTDGTRIPCPTCDGAGEIYEDDGEFLTACETCEGDGTVVRPGIEGALTKEQKIAPVFQAWLDAACEVYNMPGVIFSFDDARRAAMYLPSYDDNTAARIVEPKPSILRLFQLFAEHRGDNSMSRSGQKPDAWGLSLYYTVKPRLFRKLVRAGRMGRMIRASDLYSTATLAKIHDAGLDPAHNDVIATLARIDAGEDVFGSTEALSLDDEREASEALSGEANLDRLRALASSDQDDDDEDDADTEADGFSAGEEELEPVEEMTDDVDSEGNAIEGNEPWSGGADNGHDMTTLGELAPGEVQGAISGAAMSAVADRRSALDAMNRDDIRRMARELGVLNVSAFPKAELIEKIMLAEASVTA